MTPQPATVTDPSDETSVGFANRTEQPIGGLRHQDQMTLVPNQAVRPDLSPGPGAASWHRAQVLQMGRHQKKEGCGDNAYLVLSRDADNRLPPPRKSCHFRPPRHAGQELRILSL